MRNLIAMVTLLAVIATACGGGGSVDPSDSPLAQAMASQFAADEDAPFEDLSEAECFAGAAVGEIGEDRLSDLGVTVDNVGDIQEIDFTSSEVDTLVQAMSTCVDLKKAIAAQLEGDFGAEPAACVAENLSDDVLAEAMRAGFAGAEAGPSGDFLQAFISAAGACNVPIG